MKLVPAGQQHQADDSHERRYLAAQQGGARDAIALAPPTARLAAEEEPGWSPFSYREARSQLFVRR